MASFISYVPASAGVILLGGRPASSLFAVDGVGVSGCIVDKAFWFAGSARSSVRVESASDAAGICIVLVGGARLYCLSAAFSESFELNSLVASVTSACVSGTVVYPVVAATGDVAASSYFCGLAHVGPGIDEPASGVSAL